MGVQAIGKAPAHEVEVSRTPVTRADMRASIARAYEKVKGHVASEATLDILTAQASLETANGSKMNNFNFAGIKGHGPSGLTAKYQTFEFIDGKRVDMVDGFRAYQSLDEGAVDYVNVLGARFGKALSRAELGDVSGFAHELKQSGYYTASEDSYRNALEGIVGHKLAGVAAQGGMAPTAPMDSDTLSRIMDMMRGGGGFDQAGSIARIVAPE
jgi:hypothetical protein